jgi:hypothetical protein
MTRSEVYTLIDGERRYQDKRWSDGFDDDAWGINDWIVFIERYIQEAKDRTGYPNQMNSVRKIAALAVAAMEYNETEGR